MKRAWNISFSLRDHLIHKPSPHHSLSPRLTIPFSPLVTGSVPTTADFRLTRGICDEASSSPPSSDSIQTHTLSEKPIAADFRPTRPNQGQTPPASAQSKAFDLLTESFRPLARISREEMQQVLELKDELLSCHEKGPSGVLLRVLDENVPALLKAHPSGWLFVELLEQLRGCPSLVLEVLNWRRNQVSCGLPPMTKQEYSKAITISGRARNISLAAELFTEAANSRVKTTSTYNSLLGAYMANGLANKCRDLFKAFKLEVNCRPNIVTYNILISVFGRLTMVDQMEAILREIEDRKLFPTLYTYNYLIAGYLTAWSWDKMEKTFTQMKDAGVTPDLNTYMLMLRGYSHSGKIDKMEEMYHLLKEQNANGGPVLGCMIAGYCKSTHPDRVSRISELTNLLSDDDYRPWLQCLLINFYAREEMLEKMESLIDEAFERHTAVLPSRMMRTIITVYYRANAVDKLARFVRRAEDAGWTVCRSLYHCQMLMYGEQNRLEEMEDVIGVMERFNISSRTKKTFCILYMSYMKWGQRLKADKVVGLVWKCGYEIREVDCLS